MTTVRMASGDRVRMLAGHGIRLAMVVAVAWLVHAAHERHLVRRGAVDLAAVSLDLARRHLPEAATIGGDSLAVGGGLDVLDGEGGRVGTILRTSPIGDQAIGFSGPTDLLVVCDADLRVAGMEILSSGDTRDHVRAVERDARFLASLTGRPLVDLAQADLRAIDAVAGSTLTSMAILDAVMLRLGGREAGSRFEKEPSLADVQLHFPGATVIEQEPGEPAVIHVLDAAMKRIGWCLRTSPAADRVIGYQGPTDALVGFDGHGKVVGVAVLASFDNEPYVGYVRDDDAFRGVWRGMAIEALAGIDPVEAGVDGVSGATMTSQAIAEGIVRAVREHRDRLPAARGWSVIMVRLRAIDPPQLGGITVIVAGIVTAFTRARGLWFGRLVLPVVVILYLGFGAGAVLSLAQFAGWSQAGVPAGATVLTVLTAVALLFPMTTKRNVYCAHLCPHGAAQHVILRVAKPKRSVSKRWRSWLVAFPWVLLALAILAVVVPLPIALVDLEPFDAYLPFVAGLPALVIFVVSVAASVRYPMAYCRYGCPTGALLDHLRLHRGSARMTWRDGVVLGCLAVALGCFWWSG